MSENKVSGWVDEQGVRYIEDNGVALPILNWCRECWDECAPKSERLPDECPECGSTNLTYL